MTERKFKLGDRVVPSDSEKDHRVGEVVELSTFKPDGKKPHHFKAGLYGSFCCGVVWFSSKVAIYHFEKHLNIA